MRGKSVSPAGRTGFGALLPLLALGWLLSGCGAQTTLVSVAGNHLQTQPVPVRVPTGTAKKGPATFRLAPGTPTPPVLTPAGQTLPATQIGSTSPSFTLTALAQQGHPISAQLVAPGPFNVVPAASCAASTTDCTLSVNFTPVGTGPVTGTILVTDLVNGLSTTAILTGTGVPVPQPALAVSASSLNFGPTQVGATSAAQSLTLINTGTAPFTLSAIVFTGADASDYRQSNTCAAPLAPGATCTLAVTFSPAVAGGRAATLQIAGNATPLAVSLLGTAVPAPAPVLSLSVSSVAFAATALGATIAAQPITLTNTGNASLSIPLFVLTGSAAADYSERNGCAAPLPPGASCTLSIFFTPVAGGNRSATLQIVTNASTLPAILSLAGIGTALGPTTLVPGANAILPFTETTGTIAHDTSGNGNDCTFANGASAPTWANGGLQFNDGSDPVPRFCTLPASATNADATVMNSRTLTLCAYFHPVDTQNDRSYAAVFGGSNRFNIGALWLSGAAHVRSAYYMGDYFGYGGIPTFSTQPLAGYHCVTYALGSVGDGTPDRFYIDDAEVTSYGAQGTVWDKRAPGDSYEIGAIPWDGGSFLWGTVYAVVTYPTQLTLASIAHNFAVLQQSSFYIRGVGGPSRQSTTSTSVLVTNGDSFTNQTPGGVLPYPYLLSLNTPFTLANTAVGGKLLETEVADSPLLDLPLYSPNSPFAFVSNAAGINDIKVGGSTLAQIVGYRAAIDAGYKQQGFTVLSPTMISSIGADGEVQAINAALRTAALANGYFLVDWANEPCLGATGVYADPTGCAFFQGDGLHPSQAGENEMARLYSNVVNYLTGSTATAPTVVPATAYTLAPADRFLTADGPTSQTITLPACYGWSVTTPFALTNANLTGSVTLMPSPGFTLNSGTAPVTIPTATTVQVYADLLSATASGCGWHTR